MARLSKSKIEAIETLVTQTSKNFHYYYSASEGWVDVSKMEDKHLYKSLLKHSALSAAIMMYLIERNEIAPIVMRILSNISYALFTEYGKRAKSINKAWFKKANHGKVQYDINIPIASKEEIEYVLKLWKELDTTPVEKWNNKEHELSKLVSKYLSFKKIIELADDYRFKQLSDTGELSVVNVAERDNTVSFPTSGTKRLRKRKD